MPPAPAPPPSLQLSLFDDAPTAAPAAPSPAPPAPRSLPPAPVPLATAGPTAFRHPRSHGDIRLGEHLVAYELRRARRRSIGFVVGVDGLSVSAPRWVGLGEVEAALREKAGWILRKLHEQRERAQRLAAARVDWRDGSTIPFLGETVILVLDPRATGAVLNTAAEALPGVPRLTLHLGLPGAAAHGRFGSAGLRRKFVSLRRAGKQYRLRQSGTRLTGPEEFDERRADRQARRGCRTRRPER